MTATSNPPTTDDDRDVPPTSVGRELVSRISHLEIVVASVLAAILLVLVLLEPDILEAPFENERTVLFTIGGTVLAAIAFVAMLWFRVPPVVRVVVLVVPFAMVNWWLISPYFIDDVVDEEFSTSITEQLDAGEAAPAPEGPVVTDARSVADVPTTDATPEEPDAEATATAGNLVPATDAAAEQPPAPPSTAPARAEPPATDATAEQPPPPPPSGPVLLGAGQFVGLAGHSGTGDAGIFRNPDGSLVLRFENFDIENGPDLEVYLVPGPDQTTLAAGSIHLGALKGNIGDQNYDVPGTELAPGAYTALVWCEAFTVEFVGATIVV